MRPPLSSSSQSGCLAARRWWTSSQVAQRSITLGFSTGSSECWKTGALATAFLISKALLSRPSAALLTGQAARLGLSATAARAVRRVLDVALGRRFASFRDIAQLLGAGASYNLAPKVDGIRALRTEGPEGVRIHLRNHGESAEAQAQHLFAMARALGDAACFSEERVAPVNDLHNSYRQAAGRAFAAEFLAPIDEIRSMLADRHDLITIADEFAVSPNVIERQIENAERIDAACS